MRKLGARSSAITSREADEGVYAVTSQISYCERREKEESRTNQRSPTKKKCEIYAFLIDGLGGKNTTAQIQANK